MAANDEVLQIKERADIVAIIGERVNLKKSGRNFKGLCPFHGEKTPSFFVTPEMQMFKCFGCQEAGDIFSFLQKYEGWSFPETLEFLAKKLGITLTPYRKTPMDSTREREYELVHLAAEYYHYLLVKHAVGQRARDYLKSRGVHQQSIKDFIMGYAPESWDGVQKFLVGKKKYQLSELEKVGLVIGRQMTGNKGQTKGYYDRFRGRVMFPLKDFAGHMVGFAGRLLDTKVKEAHLASSGQAKYINSPETGIYHKSECLFGLTQAKRAIREADRMVVVEGEMDVILSHQAEVRETVAVKGSALTERQVLNARKLTKNLVLAMDADQAGQEAIKRGIEVAEKQGMNLAVIEMGEEKDPAEIVLVDPKKWREMSKKTVPVYQFLINHAFKTFDVNSGTGQKQIMQTLSPVLTKIENRVEKAFYVKKLAERLGTNAGVVEQELVRVGVGEPQKPMIERTEKRMERREKVERSLISMALQFDEATTGFGTLAEEWFGQTYLKHLIELVKKQMALGKGEMKKIIAELPVETADLAKDLYGDDRTIWQMDQEDIFRAMERGKSQLRELALREDLHKTSERLAGLEPESAEAKALLTEYRRLSRLLKTEE